MSAGTSSSSIDRVSGVAETGTEDAPLIPEDSFQSTGSKSGSGSGYGMSGRKYGRKRNISVAEAIGGSNSLLALTNFSTTTVVGLLLILAMVTLTILSVFLQRYSTNTYIDIIVPPQNSSNATNASTIDIFSGPTL